MSPTLSKSEYEYCSMLSTMPIVFLVFRTWETDVEESKIRKGLSRALVDVVAKHQFRAQDAVTAIASLSFFRMSEKFQRL